MSDITFPGAVNGTINCLSRPQDNGVKIKVGPLPGTQIGAKLTLYWKGYSDREGQQLIAGTEISFDHSLTESDVANGVEKTVDNWKEHIKPIKNGSARVFYTINGGGGKNALVQVRLMNPSEQSCDEV